MTDKKRPPDNLEQNLKYLKLPFMKDQHQDLVSFIMAQVVLEILAVKTPLYGFRLRGQKSLK